MSASCLKDYQGLLGGHAYTILGAVEFLGPKNAVQHQLVKLRNPIGHEVYTGPWNNLDDQRWTQNYKKQAGVQPNSGVFFMSVPNFKKAFGNYDITYYHEDWKQSS